MQGYCIGDLGGHSLCSPGAPVYPEAAMPTNAASFERQLTTKTVIWGTENPEQRK